MRPSEKAKEYGTTLKEIEEFTETSRNTQINWFRRKTKLFVVVCWGIRAMKEHNEALLESVLDHAGDDARERIDTMMMKHIVDNAEMAPPYKKGEE